LGHSDGGLEINFCPWCGTNLTTQNGQLCYRHYKQRPEDDFEECFTDETGMNALPLAFPLLTNSLVARLNEYRSPDHCRLKGLMPPKRSNTLTEAELRIMRVLWTRGESLVSDLVMAISEDTPLAYTSVLTTVRILEQKGYVEHRQEGRAFLYRPCIAEHEASRSEVSHLLLRFFGNSREQLLLTLLGDGDITHGELQRLKRAIAEAEASGERGDA
jgi:predicted transcriptional regulator